MKKTILKQILATFIALSLLSCTVITSFAEETTVTAGYDTKNTHVYSPMDLVAVTQSSTSADFTLVGNTYDSTMWKFATDSDSNFEKTADIAAPSVKAIKGGLKLSWSEVAGTDSYTVKVAQVGGDYTAIYETENTEFLFTTLELGKTYAFQIVTASGASKILTYKNILAGTTVKSNDDGGAAIIGKDDGYAETFIISVDDIAKKAFTANGALLIKVQTTKYPELSGEILDAENNITYGDAWLASNTLIYPSDANGLPSADIIANDYYSNLKTNSFMLIQENGEVLYSKNLAKHGVIRDNYKNYQFENGYILIPFDDFDDSDAETKYKINLLETVKQTGALILGNTVKNYYYKVGDSVVAKNFGTADDALKTFGDRDLSFPEIYVISDYNAYVAGGLESVSEISNILLSDVAYKKTSKAANLDNYFEFSSENANSLYKFYCSTNSYTKKALVYTKRAIKYTAANGEKMSLGFTAPETGMYEISAPITVESGTNVKYAVYKTDANGNRVCLQDIKEYTTAGNFCNLQVNLAKDDTVWLEATGDEGAIINIGIPQAIKYKNITVGETETTYTYRVMDYFEDVNNNGKTYGNFTATSDTAGAWDFGYFKFGGTFGTVLSTFSPDVTLINKAIDSDSKYYETPLDEGLLSSLKEYEILRAGNFYNVWDVTSGASTASAVSGPGVMFASAYQSALDATTAIQTYFHTGTGTDSETLDTYGNWFKFTAPVGGTAKFNSPTQLAKAIMMVIAKNNKVVFSSYDTKDVAGDIDIGSVNAGDEITVLYYAIKSTTAAQSIAIADPYITLSGNYSNLTLVAKDVTQNQIAANGDIVLSAPAKDKDAFSHWIDAKGNKYKSGEIFTLNGDTVLTAVYGIIGDIDANNAVDAVDLIRIRKYITGYVDNITADRLSNADTNNNKVIDIADLVRIKKIIAGIA